MVAILAALPFILGFIAMVAIAFLIAVYGDDLFLGLMCGLCAGMMAFFLGMLISGVACGFVTGGEPCNSVEQWDLRAAGDSTDVHISFFIFAGSIDGVDMYKYYYVSHDCPMGEKECVKKGSVRAADASIIEEDRTDGVLMYCAKMNDKAIGLGCPIPDDDQTENACYPNMYVFRVPRGSISNKFNFDLSG